MFGDRGDCGRPRLGKTPLHLAAAADHQDVVRVLSLAQSRQQAGGG
ncbi:MAG: hypothetical protein AB7W28_06115 [Armatimonadota bacterium]